MISFLGRKFTSMRRSTSYGSMQYRGLLRNLICIGIGCDLSGHVFCTIEGNGKTSAKNTLNAFLRHIESGCTLIHDGEKSHVGLVKELSLSSEAYCSKSLKDLTDKENPLDEINQRCRQLKQFLNSHSGFDRANLSDYLNLFAFIANPPSDPYKKIEILFNRIFETLISLNYREKYSN